MLTLAGTIGFTVTLTDVRVVLGCDVAFIYLTPPVKERLPEVTDENKAELLLPPFIVI